ncbi:MAG: hypothetical protein H7840_02635, partial [Alphaproteobacteria bacterium]
RGGEGVLVPNTFSGSESPPPSSGEAPAMSQAEVLAALGESPPGVVASGGEPFGALSPDTMAEALRAWMNPVAAEPQPKRIVLLISRIVAASENS